MVTLSRNFQLRNYTLGLPLETFGPNIRVIAILLVLALLFCGLAFAVASDLRDHTAWWVFYALTAAFAAIVLWYLVSRVWLHEMGISYRGIFGYGEIRWLELDRFYFGSYQIDAHYIPLGTFYRLKLISTHGQKVSLGERVRHADELAERIGKFSFEPLMQKALQTFNSGGVVDFGAILVSRTEGVTVAKLLSDAKIPWQEIEGYDILSSHVTLHRFHKRFACSVGSDRVANLPVLRALLDGVMHHVWQH
jgi:hypothetical protein